MVVVRGQELVCVFAVSFEAWFGQAYSSEAAVGETWLVEIELLFSIAF